MNINNNKNLYKIYNLKKKASLRVTFMSKNRNNNLCFFLLIKNEYKYKIINRLN